MNPKYYDGNFRATEFDDGGNPYVDGNDEGIQIDIKWPEIIPATESATNFFASKQFDLKYYEQVKETYRMGGFYHVNGEICRTLREFDRFLYNYFVRNFWNDKKELEHLVWGINPRLSQNPYEPFDMNQVYYDGVVFGIVKEEFLHTLLDYTPARILSFIIHYGNKLEYTTQYI